MLAFVVFVGHVLFSAVCIGTVLLIMQAICNALTWGAKRLGRMLKVLAP
jgi:hypothetical protein